ncbi:MAG: S8 family serine peptidase [Planctomycetes bacterium]|nr:S8 family serine peptidase [Planctomycetota bacterium]
MVSIIAVFLCAVLSSLSFALRESTGPGGSNAQAVHALGYDGLNINIGFISQDNLLVSHEAFYEKDPSGLPTGPQHAFVHDTLGFGIDATSHDTRMAGIIVSNGGQNEPNQIGVAPKADLHNIRVVSGGSINTTSIQDALTELITVYNCKVIITGIALPIDGNGQSIWSRIHDYYAQTYDVIFAYAAGNNDDGVSTKVIVFGDAYNGITTAGLVTTPWTDIYDYDKVGSVSLPGPTTDGIGRNKPDVAAPSTMQTVPSDVNDFSWEAVPGSIHGFTSYAVPHTAGVAALLLDYADESGDTDREHSEVIKAVMVNSTFPNIIDKTDAPTTGLNWHADRGYGRLDALRAYETLSALRIVQGDPATTNLKGWGFDSIKKNDTHAFKIMGKKNQRLVTTVTWHRKLNASYLEESPRFFVDVEILSMPGGSTVTSQAADLDNLIKIDTLLPDDGEYQIVVKNAPQNNPLRNYAIAFELLNPLEADFNIDYVVDIDDVTDLASYWLNTGCIDPVPCYLYDLSDNDSIDLGDFSIFAQQWLDYDSRYYTP